MVSRKFPAYKVLTAYAANNPGKAGRGYGAVCVRTITRCAIYF